MPSYWSIGIAGVAARSRNLGTHTLILKPNGLYIINPSVYLYSKSTNIAHYLHTQIFISLNPPRTKTSTMTRLSNKIRDLLTPDLAPLEWASIESTISAKKTGRTNLHSERPSAKLRLQKISVRSRNRCSRWSGKDAQIYPIRIGHDLWFDTKSWCFSNMGCWLKRNFGRGCA